MKTIGCCDSGLGGLLTSKALHEAYPDLDVVFIADQSNVPYGDKTVQELEIYARQFMNTFQEMGIFDVVVACNTLCANALETIREDYPQMNIINIIEPTARQLLGKNYEKIQVLATRRTIETHLYKKLLSEYAPKSEVVEIMAPLLVPLIEKGADEETMKQAIQATAPHKSDAWVLGCTHYPLIAHYLEGDVYDSNQAVLDLFKDESFDGSGKFDIYTTKDPQVMKKKIKDLFNLSLDVKEIKLKQS